jgi:probable phosphoglycerate mutase
MLYLCRHGNNFQAGDKVVCAGLTNDLALVEKGHLQAQAQGQFFARLGIKSANLYCGKLQRHQQTAQGIAKAIPDSNIIIDEALNEIDYGGWTGLSDAEIIEKFGQREFDNWHQQAIFAPSWESRDAIITRVEQFILKISQNHQKPAIIISSNGILRFFLLYANCFDEYLACGKLKMKTGAVSAIDLATKQLLFWNYNPSV